MLMPGEITLTFSVSVFTMLCMRQWHFSEMDPICTRLSADARSKALDIDHDHSWDLSINGNHPPAIQLKTTYGLHAKHMHLYPYIGWDDHVLGDPLQFHTPPIITTLFPDYAQMVFEPLEGLEATAEFFVADSNTLLGRITVKNHTLTSHQARLKLHVDLVPEEDSGGMRKRSFKGGVVLAGQTGGLEPVLVVCSGAVVQETAHPALVVRDRLDPDGQRSWRFALVARDDFHASVLHAREQCALDWEAAMASLEQRNEELLDIRTGDPAWDAAIWMTQKEICRHLVSPTRKMPFTGFVTRRTPDDRLHAVQGNQAEPPETAPNVADAYWMASQLVEFNPDLALGVVRNFLANQDPDGFIDGRPGLRGERSGEMCIPLLADLVWKVYQRSGDASMLRNLYTPLHQYFEAWFSEQNDADLDGHPEWHSTFQAGYNRWPAFLRWQKWGQGLKIARAETMDLASYLHREAIVLERMAELLGEKDDVAGLRARRERLHDAVESAWSARAGCYQHVDRDEHVSPRGKRIGRGKGEFTIEIDGRYEDPVRLLVRVRCKVSMGKSIGVRIHGRGKRGRPRIERLAATDFDWFWDYGVATTDKTYIVLSEINVVGVSERCSTEISIADFTREDQAGLLPLWSGIPDPERGRLMVEKTILDPTRFWRPAGIPRCSAGDKAYDPTGQKGCGGVSMLWSTMIGEALLEAGCLTEAADLLGRLMRNAIDSLRIEKGFHAEYNPDDGTGIGKAHDIAGAAPLNLLLRVLGVMLFSPRKIWVRGRHPLPWPVTLRWKGLELRLDPAGVKVTFPDGQSEEWADAGPMVIEQLD